MYVPPRLMFSKRWEQFSSLTRATILSFNRDNIYDHTLKRQRPLNNQERIRLCFHICRMPDIVKASALGIFSPRELVQSFYNTEEGKARVVKKLFELTKDCDGVFNVEYKL